MRVLLWLALLLCVQPALALQTLEQADRLDSLIFPLPPDNLDWRPVKLPDAWIGRQVPRVAAASWYRMRFDVSEDLRSDHLLFIRRFRGPRLDLYLNGEPIASSSDIRTHGHQIVPFVVRIPPRLLREGSNTLHAYIVADPAFLHGMPRVFIGTKQELAQHVRYWKLLQEDVFVIFAFALGLVGMLALAFWAIDRSDALFWYGISGFAFAVVTAVWFVSIGNPGYRLWLLSVYFLMYYAVITPLAIVHLRLAGWRWPWFEAALWSLLVLASMLIASSDMSVRIWAWTGFGLFYSVLPMLFVIPIARARKPVRPISRAALAIAGVGASALALHDWAARAGILPLDSPQLVLYVVPLFMLAVGSVMFERYLVATRRQREVTADLEARVAQKSREIEAAHAQMRAADEERALVRERRRIMADMHDGLGSRLVGLLSQVQSGKADARQLEEGLTAALEELRTTIDSLQPVEGDLGVVLGNVRHRMRSVFDTAGLELGWRVGELPRMADLTPARNLAIQRILLELFANVLKHSGAHKVDVSTQAAVGRASILIEDDGRGFVVGSPINGRGLSNLQERAREAGGTLVIESAPGRGTRATLALPAAA